MKPNASPRKIKNVPKIVLDGIRKEHPSATKISIYTCSFEDGVKRYGAEVIGKGTLDIFQPQTITYFYAVLGRKRRGKELDEQNAMGEYI
jgi:hypothetical protein